VTNSLTSGMGGLAATGAGDLCRHACDHGGGGRRWGGMGRGEGAPATRRRALFNPVGRPEPLTSDARNNKSGPAWLRGKKIPDHSGVPRELSPTSGPQGDGDFLRASSCFQISGTACLQWAASECEGSGEKRRAAGGEHTVGRREGAAGAARRVGRSRVDWRGWLGRGWRATRLDCRHERLARRKLADGVDRVRDKSLIVERGLRMVTAVAHPRVILFLIGAAL
jgi:hypothetical protein